MRVHFKWEGWDLIFPMESWDGVTWYGGHFGSGREPSSEVYNPKENDRMHAGFDFGCKSGTPLFSMADGVVTEVGHNTGAGNYVVLEHISPWGTRYWYRALHILDGGTKVVTGQVVRAGDTIALAGSTGSSMAPHLHAELTIVPPYVHFTEDKHVDIEYVIFGKFGRKDSEMLTLFQKELKERGYYTGVVDGIMGPKSEAAMEGFISDSLERMKNHRHANRLLRGMTGWVKVWEGK